jgi:hypothetical protein
LRSRRNREAAADLLECCWYVFAWEAGGALGFESVGGIPGQERERRKKNTTMRDGECRGENEGGWVSVGSFVGGLIALAVVELLLLIYVFAKLLTFRAHKKQQNSASSSAVGIHTSGTTISFNLQVSPFARSLALFLLLDLSHSLCRLVFARIGCFPVC